mmetsp:Transcript_12515/g.40964  ORF Transcript_12515/g.40964 Transcript_12515/m.40964 type:complete len:148 (-) Transcript_12515:530-973(-)
MNESMNERKKTYIIPTPLRFSLLSSTVVESLLFPLTTPRDFFRRHADRRTDDRPTDRPTSWCFSSTCTAGRLVDARAARDTFLFAESSIDGPILLACATDVYAKELLLLPYVVTASYQSGKPLAVLSPPPKTLGGKEEKKEVRRRNL